MKRPVFLSVLATIMLGFSAYTFADVYNNGRTLGNAAAYSISGDIGANRVSDSFVPSGTPGSRVTITSFSFAEWVPAGSTPLTVGWAFGDESFSGDLGGGGGPLASAFLLCRAGTAFNGGICGGGVSDVYLSTMSVGFPLNDFEAGNTYWLTLQGATDTTGAHDGWDVNFRHSLAYFNNESDPIPSESFTINGTTPEPSSIVLFGFGTLGIAGVLRRKLNL